MPEGYGGLAPVSLVVNEAGHAATRRAHVSVEPPRTGEEEEQKVDSDSGGVVGEDRLSGDDFLNSAGPLSGYDQDFPPLSSSENTSAVDFHSAPAESSTKNDVGHDEASKNAKSKASKMDNSKASASKSDNSKAQGSKKDAPKGQAAKTAAPNQPKVAKYRDAGGHAVDDDDIAQCEAMADAFYKNPEDMNSFLDGIHLLPKSQVFELSIKLDERFRDWSERVLCSQFVKENTGSLWESKYSNLLIHKRNPLTMVISCYDLKTCVAMGGTTFMLGGKAFQVPQYSRYGPNYYVTFTKVNNPDMARAIVAELASLTKAVIAAFNPTANQT
ncbi:hypothetical protein As57867_020173, partial [Aphanomyces stellatus]